MTATELYFQDQIENEKIFYWLLKFEEYEKEVKQLSMKILSITKEDIDSYVPENLVFVYRGSLDPFPRFYLKTDVDAGYFRVPK
jgi:hypothetical protein